MRILMLLAIVATLFVSCGPTTYEVKDIYGTWQGETMGLVLNEDGSMEMTLAGEKMPGDLAWRSAMGNTLEFTKDGLVFMANVTVKGIKDDVLTIETRPLMTGKEVGTVSHEMRRVK